MSTSFRKGNGTGGPFVRFFHSSTFFILYSCLPSTICEVPFVQTSNLGSFNCKRFCYCFVVVVQEYFYNVTGPKLVFNILYVF